MYYHELRTFKSTHTTLNQCLLLTKKRLENRKRLKRRSPGATTTPVTKRIIGF